MKRAAVLGIAFAAALRAPASAQPAGKMYRVGMFTGGTGSAAIKDAFVRDLAGLGYRQGQNLELIVRFANSQYGRIPTLANELVRARPDVIVAGSPPVVAALKRATRSVPIVMINVPDPVALGFVTSLARPGGNITGVTNLLAQSAGKRLQLLTELVPTIRRVAVIENPANPVDAPQYLAACRELGIEDLSVGIPSAAEIDSVLRALPQRHADALAVAADAMFVSNASHIVKGIAALRLPAVYGGSQFPEAGGLMSYAPSVLGQYALAATYVDRILKGTKAADLPVQQPMTFDLVVNLKTAHALGIMVPQSILLQATQVIR